MQVYETTPFDLIASTMSRSETFAGHGQAVGALVGLIGQERAEALLAQLRLLAARPEARLWSPPVVER